MNTLAVHIDVPGGPDTPLAYDTIADDIWAWLGAYYRNMLVPAYTVDELHVLGIVGTSGEGTHTVGSTGTIDVSSFSTIPLPKECAAVLSWKTSTPGRSGRGRMFVPSPRLGAFLADATSWNTSNIYWTGIGAFAQAVLDGDDVTHGVLEYHYSGRLWSRSDNVTRDLTAYQRRPAVHWLRSRSTAP